jgi:thymidylate synthase ThyX
MNFRQWRHFIELRCDKAAQWEIREVAKRILEILNMYAPSVFGDLHEKFCGVNSDDGNGESRVKSEVGDIDS